MREIENRINKMIKRSEVILNAGKQTNEEYLKSCNTEQLAEKLWELYNAGKDDAKTYDTFEYFIDKEDVLEWLKQPHNGE